MKIPHSIGGGEGGSYCLFRALSIFMTNILLIQCTLVTLIHTMIKYRTGENCLLFPFLFLNFIQIKLVSDGGERSGVFWSIGVRSFFSVMSTKC